MAVTAFAMLLTRDILDICWWWQDRATIARQALHPQARADIGTGESRTKSSAGRLASELAWGVGRCQCGAGPIGDYVVAPALPAADEGRCSRAGVSK